MAQVTMLEPMMRMVAPKTIHPPHCMCGTNRRMSTRKASRVTSRVGKVRMRRARRYRGEWDGPWKCAATARPKQMRFSRAAMGWTMRMEERLLRVLEGSEKSSLVSPPEKRPSAGMEGQ
jgi:hypothetical protein